MEIETDEPGKDPYTAAIAKQLQVELKEAGVTQKRVADETGIKYQTLGRYLRGERDMSVGTLGAITSVIGVLPETVWEKARARITEG